MFEEKNISGIQKMSENEVDEKIDLRGVLCPINFVKTKLKLETMESDQILEVTLDDGEPMRNVPRSVKEDGHKIVKVEKLETILRFT